MKEKTKKYKVEITEKEVNDFIAVWLNEENENYPVYVKGVKLFIEYLKGKSS